MATRIISLNTGGLGNSIKRRKIFSEYRDRCDILCLQETHCSDEICDLWKSEWGGVALFANNTTSSGGVAVLINRKFYCNVYSTYRDNAGRFIIVSLEIQDLKCTLVSLYAPNKDSPGFFNELLKKLEEFDANKIIIGDFNLVFDVRKDRRNSTYNNNKAREILIEHMECNYLCDIWRDRNPEAIRYSWYRNRSASRIDFCILSQGLANRTEDCFYMKGFDSDHAAVVLVIKNNIAKRGPGFWKFNNALLYQKDYVNKMSQKLQIWERGNNEKRHRTVGIPQD